MDGDTTAVLIRALVKAGDCSVAITVGRGFLSAFGRIEPVAVPVQLGMGVSPARLGVIMGKPRTNSVFAHPALGTHCRDLVWSVLCPDEDGRARKERRAATCRL